MTSAQPVPAPEEPPPGAAPKVSAKARRTRARLLSASRKIFERDGFVEARVSDITAAAGVSHGTFYTYFTSKDDIFKALVLDLVHDFGSPSSADPAQDPEEAFQAIRHTNAEYAEMIRKNARLMNVWRQAASVNTELAELLRVEDGRVIGRAEHGIKRFRTLGFAHPRVDERYLARALGTMTKEFCAQIFNEEQQDFDGVVDTLTDIWATAIGLPLPTDRRPEDPA